MSKIPITGEAWREKGTWTFTMKGPKWLIEEMMQELATGTLKVTSTEAGEPDYAVATCTTERVKGKT